MDNFRQVEGGGRATTRGHWTTLALLWRPSVLAACRTHSTTQTTFCLVKKLARKARPYPFIRVDGYAFRHPVCETGGEPGSG
jgi:hypothetical protein